MEDPVRTDALTACLPCPEAAKIPVSRNSEATRSSYWLQGPAFDLLLLANVGWCVFLVPGFASADGDTPVSFWQMYFLTTPHRWLTLGLVALDSDRRGSKTWIFITLALFFLAAVLGIRLISSAYLCLFAVDYVWNAWHFGSQHAGVLRMYSRKANVEDLPWLERHGLRAFVFYTILRTAAWTTGWLETTTAGVDWLHRLDIAALLLPALLLWGVGFRDARRLPKRVYLASICLLYSGLLLALRGHHTPLILSLTVAVALFHAVEYLAVVTLYARRRQTVGSDSPFRPIARHWMLSLTLLILALGVFGLLGERWLPELWLGLNLWAGLVHYAYDGMIWKLRVAETARALGV